MSEALQRGSVVLRAGWYSVVWDVRGADLVLLPVAKPGKRRHAHEVDLSLPDLLAGGIAVPDARVQAGAPIQTDAAGHVCTGTLQGAVLCRVVAAYARAYASARAEQTWEHERRHRHEAASVRVVRL